jgi:hypothetical protein
MKPDADFSLDGGDFSLALTLGPVGELRIEHDAGDVPGGVPEAEIEGAGA